MTSERTHQRVPHRHRCGMPAASIVALAVALGIGCARARVPVPDSFDDTVAAPVRYDAHRFFLRPVTTTGDTLLLFMDTGGINVLRRSVAEQGGMFPTPQLGPSGDTSWVVPLPHFKESADLPMPARSVPLLMDVSSEQAMASMAKVWPGTRAWSGQVGSTWFSAGVWRFDYVHGQVLLMRHSAGLAAPGPHVIPLALKITAGPRRTNFARVRAEIDGDSLDLLFDTGATSTLTDSAWRAIGDGLPRERATSFMAASVFDRWHQRHPNWRFVPRAEFYTTRDMIEVPVISIAGFSVGPVWFTRRLDEEYLPYVSADTDRPVIGALGGSGLQYFAITADYARGLAEFSRPR